MIVNEATRQSMALDAFVTAGHHQQRVYGLQWGIPEEAPQLRRAKDEFVLPALNSEMTVIEIGCGGGRWSRYFRERVEKAYLVDATQAAEAAVRAHCDWAGFEFVVASDGRMPSIETATVDYAFSFDTFVHFHRELFDTYISEVSRILKPGALFHLLHAKRWPDSIVNEQIFQYRDDDDVSALLASGSFRLTNRSLEFRVGFGSILREAVRLLR
ncbi:MAG TPA: class I SAM-dependent methyltransferase [Pirellulales bacterium]|nr:class I SAM-dependent methyltransferase [Pirellulales bacterium]